MTHPNNRSAKVGNGGRGMTRWLRAQALEPIYLDLNPGSILYQLCDLGHITQGF